MKNKHLSFCGIRACLAVAVIAVTVGFMSCQEEYKPMDQIQKLADKNIPGTYSWIKVDENSMQTKICEYVLKSDGTGEYCEMSTGADMQQQLVSTSFTWTRGNYVDNNVWVEIALDFPDGAAYSDATLKWGSATLRDGDRDFSRAAYINNVASIYNNFANQTWAKADTTWYSRVDTVNNTYLEWAQVKGDASYLTEEEIAEQKAYFAQQWVKDTIAWYNETYKKNVPDSIRTTAAKKNGKTFCVFYQATEKTVKVPVTTHTGIAKIDCNQIRFEHSATYANTGEHVYHYYVQDNEDVTKGYVYDSIVTYTINKWCISKPTNSAAFELQALGNVKTKVTEKKDGLLVKESAVEAEGLMRTYAMTQFYLDDGEITIDGKKHLLVK